MTEPTPLSGRATVVNVIASFVASAFAATIFLAFGVLLKRLQVSFDVSTTSASFIYLAQWSAFGVMSFILGVSSDRIGVVTSIRVGLFVIVAGMGLAWASFNFLGFLVGFGLMTGAGLSAAFGPMHNLILSNTDVRWQGTALGIVMAAQGVGPVILIPVVAEIADSKGARTVIGFLALAAVVTFLFSLLLRDVPGPARSRDSDVDAEVTARARQRPNYQLTAAHLLGCACHTIPLVYIVDYASSSGGLGPVAAASILSVVSLSSIASRLLSPVFGNLWGGVRTLTAVLPLQLLGTLLFILVAPDGQLWGLWVAAAIFGLGFGSEMVLFSLISRQLFEGKIGQVLGVQLVGAAVGMGGGAFVGALLLQAGASYTTLFVMALVAGVAAELIALTINAAPPRPAPALEPGGA